MTYVIAKQLWNLQALRAFAALNVVFFHIIGTASAYGYPVNIFAFLTGWGANGVDLFFVISGFVMVYIQHTKDKSPSDFIKDRLLRIAPTYWLLTLVCALLLFATPSSLVNSDPPSLFRTLQSLAFLSQLLENRDPLLYVGWTIEIEMLFYILFAVSIFSKSLLKSIVITSVLITALVIFYGANSLLLEFVFGMIVGWLFLVIKPTERTVRMILMSGILLFLLTLLFFDKVKISRFLLYGVPSALIVFGCVYSKQIGTGWITKMGDASYSIYLLQVFTIPVFYKILVKLNLINGDLNDFYALICLILSALAGLIFYYLVEIRISRNLRNWSAK